MAGSATERILEQQDRLIRERELRALIPFSSMHLWRVEQQGRFPARIKLGPNRIAWSLREVEAWVEARKAERHNNPEA